MATVDVKVPLHEAGKPHRFDPVDVTVQAGDTVTWTNEDTSSHTVTSEDDSFAEGELNNQGDTYNIDFGAEGEFPYFCQFHGTMRGKVIVVAASAN